MDNRPIGIFDSGLGGLTVVKEVRRLLPNEDVVYLGDTARVPYGTRSKEIVVRFSFQNADYLISKNVKCLVIACNTASSYAGNLLKKKLALPVFDVIEPVANKLVKKNALRKIGIIGTRGTISSHAYKKEIHKKIPATRVYEQACPLFVPLIEEGEVEGIILKKVVGKYLSHFQGENIDALVLGCTHYPIIGKEIDRFFKKKVELINPERLVAESLKEYLNTKQLTNKKRTKGKTVYLVTDISPSFLKVAELFLGTKIRGGITKVQID